MRINEIIGTLGRMYMNGSGNSLDFAHSSVKIYRVLNLSIAIHSIDFDKPIYFPLLILLESIDLCKVRSTQRKSLSKPRRCENCEQRKPTQ